MSYAKSFYADQKKVEHNENSSPIHAAAIPATTPIAEDALTPAQIQEAIRMYRTVLSNSAPSSPIRPSSAPREAVVERPQVHSNYYGGGPTDIPLSYLINYSTSSPARHVAPAPAVEQQQQQQQQFTEQQLIAQLQQLQLQQQVAAPPAVPEPSYMTIPVPKKITPRKAPVFHKMYDDEESGYCFNRVQKGEEQDQEEMPEAHVATPTRAPEATYVAPPPQATYSSPAPAAKNYSNIVCGPSEYIGMSNDCQFIYDAQKAAPNSYSQNNSYTLVNPTAAPVMAPIIHRQEESEAITEDITQVPESPMVTSRFRGIIRNAQTPSQSIAPIVVERISEPPIAQNVTPSHNYNNYGAFRPINPMSMDSEYQLPALNDLASCIEHY